LKKIIFKKHVYLSNIIRLVGLDVDLDFLDAEAEAALAIFFLKNNFN